jgi:hypothetical protein
MPAAMLRLQGPKEGIEEDGLPRTCQVKKEFLWTQSCNSLKYKELRAGAGGVLVTL